jgi:hypothetical protein
MIMVQGRIIFLSSLAGRIVQPKEGERAKTLGQRMSSVL